MKTLVFLLTALIGLLAIARIEARELAELKVLYVGKERTSDYIDFLKGKVAQIESKNRADFKADDASTFDVVLFDWPQGPDTREMRKLTSPLGTRDEWNKPTVLLGSAGLNLAVAWKMKGGSGCTCMDPLAYDLREHEIFERPFKIDRTKMISIPTPPDFQTEIKKPEIQVLSLVEDHKRNWNPGWCTYADDFVKNPDVEFFCGGVNHKTPTAAGLWRQGNLLHFGFEQSPTEMNDAGQKLLLNAIAYISRFSEDRPIAITPSVFAGPVARSRSTPARWLRNPEDPVTWVKDLVAPEIWAKLSALPDREKMAEWADANAKFFHPNEAQQLEIDEDLVALGMAFDTPEFVAKNFVDLRSDDVTTAARARRLLERYVPTGPQDGRIDSWVTWWNENQRYAFASDAGIYRWYVDPLAKKRGVPASELRGPKRADLAVGMVNDDSAKPAFYTVDHYDEMRDPADDLAKTIVRAKSEKKHILIQVGGDWCGWCKLMSKFIESNDNVRQRIEGNYLVMKVTYDPSQKNEAFLAKYPGIHGYPHLFVLDSDGKLLHSQGTAELEQGQGYNEPVYLEFLDKWKPGQ